MDAYQLYSKRLKSKGNNTTERMFNTTRELHEKDFYSSPSYYQVPIDGVLKDTIINKTTNYDVKKIHFINDVDNVLGGIVEFKAEHFLIVEKDKDEIYSFAKMQRCNELFNLKTNGTRVIIGHDPRGRPIYGESQAVEKLEPCVVKSTYFSTNENDTLPLPEGRLNILMKYQTADNLKVNEQFMMYKSTYKISDIRYTDVRNGVGIMEVSCERVVNEV